MAIAGPEIASMPSTWSAAIATGMMISAKTRMPSAWAMLARVAPASLAGAASAGSARRRADRRADPDPAQQPFDIGRDQHGFDQPADDPRDDQADEEDQPGADQPRQEGEDLGHQLVDRGEDLADAEEAERGHDADQPDDQLGDHAELVADGFLGRAGDVLAQRRATCRSPSG